MESNAGDCVEVGLAGITCYFNVLKPMISEARSISFAIRITAQSIKICRPSIAEIFGHQATIRMKHFAVPQFDLSPGRSFYFQPNNSSEILAEIEDECPVRG